jgi:hypothetical protein
MSVHSRAFQNVLTILILAVLLISLGTSSVMAQDTGYVEGQIVNQTPGGDAPANLPVTLVTYKGMSMEGTKETTTDATGAFRFENLSPAEDNIYQVVIEYKGVNYLTDFLVFDNGQIPPVTIDVYETTTNVDGIHIERSHLIINVSPRRLQVGRLYVFTNPGDRTYAGSGDEAEGVLRFSLPEGATNLQFQDGQLGSRYISTPEGFLDTSPVISGVGSHQVLVSYELEYDAPQFTFLVTDYYTVTGMNVLVSDPEVEVSSSVLQPEGFRNMQGQDWVSMAGENLAPGEEVGITMDNLPLEARAAPPPAANATTSTTPATSTNSVQLILLGLALFGIGVLVGYYLPRSPRVQEPTSGQGSKTEVIADDSDEDDLIIALADLDDAFDSGEMTEEEYQQQRAQLKRKINKQRQRKGR